MAEDFIADRKDLKYLTLQWHPTKNGGLNPKNVVAGSNKDIWWICENHPSHEWSDTPSSRSKRNLKCPFCTGKKVMKGFNDLASTNPTLAEQWHPSLNNEFTQYEITENSNFKAWWVCPVGEDHVWEAIIQSRTKGNGCPYCGNRKVLAGFNDLGSSKEYSHVVVEWDYDKNDLTPQEVSVAANKKVAWKCSSCSHEWEAIIANRTKKGSGCPVCRKTKPKVTHETIETHELAKEWHSDNVKKASEVTLGTNFMALWQCSKDSRHVWEASVANRVRGSGCLVCSGRKIIQGVNDLASMAEYSYLVEEWHHSNEKKPNEVGIGTEYSATWQCSEGHQWKALVYSRTTQKQGCPECSNRAPWSADRRHISDFPELVSQWHPDNILDPSEVSFRSAKKVKWQCPKNSLHTWEGTAFSRSLNGVDCPVCSGVVVINGVNDLASSLDHQKVVSQWHPDNILLPNAVTVGSGHAIKWQCEKESEHTWVAPVYSRTRKMGPTGCPACSSSTRTSNAERELFDFIVKLGFDNARQSVYDHINNGELDILIPEKKFALEYNGLYWHSELHRPDKNYHANKLKKCQQEGIYLYTVWEDDWMLRKAIVMRGIAHRLNATHKLHEILPDLPNYWTEKVGARSTKPERLQNREAADFLEQHHIQGKSSGGMYVGLRDKEERLRAVMVLNSGTSEGEVLISRYATAGTVVGGFTKLLKYAEQSMGFEFSHFATFADLSLSDGKLYEENGFFLEKVLAPDYSYLRNGQRNHKFSYRLSRFKKDPSLKYDEGMTERELAQLNNLYRIWDHGKNRYIKIIPAK